MTSGGYDPHQDPQGNYPPSGQGGTPPPGSYPPPGQYPPPGAYPPPPQSGYPSQPQQGGYEPAPPYNPAQQYGGFPAPGGNGTPATLGIRFGARLIDETIVGIGSVIISAILGGTALTQVFTGLIGFAWFVAFESQTGSTPGKKLLKLSVRGPGGAAKPTVEQSAKRNAFMLIGILSVLGYVSLVLSFLVGLAVIALYIVIAVTISNSPTKQGKHDELAGGTQVVKN